MKNLYFFIFCFALLNGCTITLYDGNIYPSKVEFNEPNFAYLKTIRGSSEAKYSTSGWDEKKVDGLINEAKTNMYSKHNFGANQIAANITVDYLKEGEPNSRLNGSPSLRKIRVVM